MKITSQQVTEAEIELACEIAVQVLDLIKSQQENFAHEAIMRRIEKAMEKKAEIKEENPNER